MRSLRALVAALGLSVFSIGQAAITVEVEGIPSGVPGGTLEVRMQLGTDGSTEIAAVDIILLTSPGSLILDAIGPGSLLTPSVLLDTGCLEPGAYWCVSSDTGSMAFNAFLMSDPGLTLPSGSLVAFTYQIPADAAPGIYTFNYVAFVNDDDVCGEAMGSSCVGSVQVVPEPASVAMIFAGLAVLTLFVVRRRRFAPVA